MFPSSQLKSIKVVYHSDPTLYGKGVASELQLSFATNDDALLFINRLAPKKIKAAQKGALEALSASKSLAPDQIAERNQQLNAHRSVLKKYDKPATIAPNTISLKLNPVEVDRGERVHTLLEVMNTYFKGIPQSMTVAYPSIKDLKQLEKMLEAERKILKLHQEAQLLPKPEAPQVPKAPKVLEVVPTTIELPLSSFTLTKLSLLNFEERMLHDKMKPSLEKILETKFNSQLTFFNNTTHLILSFADADNLKKAKINLAKWAVNNDLDLTYNTDTNKAAIGIRHDVVITMKPQFQISDLFEKVMNLSPAQVPALAM